MGLEKYSIKIEPGVSLRLENTKSGIALFEAGRYYFLPSRFVTKMALMFVDAVGYEGAL